MKNHFIEIACNLGADEWVKKAVGYFESKRLPSTLTQLTGDLIYMETDEGSDYWREKYEAVCRFSCVPDWPSNHFVFMDNKTKEYVRVKKNYSFRDMEIFSVYFHENESLFTFENIFKNAISAVQPPIKTKDMIDIVIKNSIIDPKDISEYAYTEEYYYTISGFLSKNCFLKNPHQEKLERFKIDLLDDPKRLYWNPLFKKGSFTVDQFLDGVILLDNSRREYTFIKPSEKHTDIALELFSFNSTAETTVLDFPS